MNFVGAERARLGRKWLEAGLGEHASVAAFAYLVLDLLALGAPPYLVHDAIRAMDDEVEHAQLSFSVAREFNGTAASPGPLTLPERCEPEPRDWAAILESAVLEGCIEEVISAECALVAFERAEDPQVHAAMSRISEDEARHAELSWRVVEWMLALRPELRPIAEAAFSRGLRPHSREDGSDQDAHMPETYGCLRAETRDRVREATVEKIIRPRAQQLLTRGSAPAPA